MSKTDSPLSLKRMLPPLSGWRGTALNAAAPGIEWLLGLSRMKNLHTQLLSKRRFISGTDEFVRCLHEEMNVTYDIAAGSLERIPKTGPLVVVANHPFGGIEATILLRLLYSVRKDVRFMANFILGRIEETKDFCFYVDPFGGDGASRRNLQPLRDCIDWVQRGGVLCVFPSGTVSHLHLRQREVTDPVWSPTVARVIRRSGAPVVPIFFSGANGWMFQAMGLIHPLLRTALLIREFANKTNTAFDVRVGNFIPFSKLASFGSDEEMITYLRLRTYILGNRTAGKPTAPLALPASKKTAAKLEKVVPPLPPQTLAQELAALPEAQLLLEGEELRVYFARARQIPNILREIGRLREITFRAVNEGTGRSIDLDHYDRYYSHLFIWHPGRQEVVGAYRIGKSDRILRRFGKSGLYTHSLFDYNSTLLEQMGPALELGRSFVRVEYQRSFTPLLFLWKGICRYVLRFPQYKVLFGPVSINNEYDSVSRELITMFLRANNFLPELAKLIRARNPMSRTKVKGMDIQTTSFVVKDIHDVSDLLEDIESKQKMLPILLRQYLKLGGKMLGFNVDANFGDVLDGLIFVDLLEAETRLLERYMGKPGVEKFYKFHGKEYTASSSKTGTAE